MPAGSDATTVLASDEVRLDGGCLVPIGAILVVAIAAAVLIAARLPGPSAPNGPREAVVRMIDDGAKGGPKVIGTAVVPLY